MRLLVRLIWASAASCSSAVGYELKHRYGQVAGTREGWQYDQVVQAEWRV